MTITPSNTSQRLVDSVELKKLGIVSSRTSLHRYLHRAPDENPFPQPQRHTVTGRRYWREGEVEHWKALEDQRRRITPDDPYLVPDDDPKAWMPKGGARHTKVSLDTAVGESMTLVGQARAGCIEVESSKTLNPAIKNG